MATTIEKTGKTVEDAVQAAINELGVTADDVNVEVLETPSKGIFGIFGTKPARIKVTVKEKPPTPADVEEIKIAVEPKVVATDAVEVKFKSVPSLDTLPNVADKFEEEKPPEKSVDEKVIEEKIVDEVELSAAPPVENVEGKTFNRDAVIETAKNFLHDVFEAMDLDLTVEVKENEENVVLDLKIYDSLFLTGKRGQLLDALQYLTNLAANRGSDEKIRFVLDVDNYRARREETLQKLAKSVAERAIRSKQDVKLEPMSRHERRIVHTILQNNKRVETHSHGEEPFRYIVVSPIRKKK